MKFDFRKAVWVVMERNEKPLTARERAGVFTLDHIEIGHSGYSVGRMQTDFSVRHSRRRELMKLLRESNTPEWRVERIDAALKSAGDINALGFWDKRLVNRILASPFGRHLVKMWDERQMNFLQRTAAVMIRKAVANPEFRRSGDFRKFAISPELSLLVADNTNQFGPARGMMRWIGNLKGPFNLQAFADYEARYKFVRSSPGGAEDMARRRRNIFRVLEEQGCCTPQERAQAEQIIAATYKRTP